MMELTLRDGRARKGERLSRGVSPENWKDYAGIR